MSVADKMSQAYLQGADDAKKQARQELEALRELCDDQQRIIESMQKQGNELETRQRKASLPKTSQTLNNFQSKEDRNEHCICYRRKC